jgi:hypothetical protein
MPRLERILHVREKGPVMVDAAAAWGPSAKELKNLGAIVA